MIELLPLSLSGNRVVTYFAGTESALAIFRTMSGTKGLSAAWDLLYLGKAPLTIRVGGAG